MQTASPPSTLEPSTLYHVILIAGVACVLDKTLPARWASADRRVLAWLKDGQWGAFVDVSPGATVTAVEPTLEDLQTRIAEKMVAARRAFIARGAEPAKVFHERLVELALEAFDRMMREPIEGRDAGAEMREAFAREVRERMAQAATVYGIDAEVSARPRMLATPGSEPTAAEAFERADHDRSPPSAEYGFASNAGDPS